MNFTCTSCQKSLLSDGRIMCDARNRQYCLKCWQEDKKKMAKETEKKFPIGSTVAWVHSMECKGRATRRDIGVVVECTAQKVKVRVGGKEKMVDASSLILCDDPE